VQLIASTYMDLEFFKTWFSTDTPWSKRSFCKPRGCTRSVLDISYQQKFIPSAIDRFYLLHGLDVSNLFFNRLTRLIKTVGLNTTRVVPNLFLIIHIGKIPFPSAVKSLLPTWIGIFLNLFFQQAYSRLIKTVI
jgi:hypothetical protein